MLPFATFALGFAAGWVTRGTEGSSRSAATAVLAAALAAVERIKRKVAIEKDVLEDLFAEARARADVLGQERAARKNVQNGTNGKHQPVGEAAA